MSISPEDMDQIIAALRAADVVVPPDPADAPVHPAAVKPPAEDLLGQLNIPATEDALTKVHNWLDQRAEEIKALFEKEEPEIHEAVDAASDVASLVDPPLGIAPPAFAGKDFSNDLSTGSVANTEAAPA